MVAPAAREDSGQRRPQEEADIPRMICQQPTKEKQLTLSFRIKQTNKQIS
jgi:hypothetical protein